MLLGMLILPLGGGIGMEGVVYGMIEEEKRIQRRRKSSTRGEINELQEKPLYFSPLARAPHTQIHCFAHTTPKTEHLCNMNTGLI